MNRRRALGAFTLGLTLLGCGEKTEAGDAAPAFPGARHLVVQDDILEFPRVVDLSRRTVDGRSAEVEVGAAELDVVFESAGQKIAFHVDGSGMQPWRGESRWCRGQDCTEGRLSAQRLWTENDAAHGFSLLGEAQGAWPIGSAVSIAVHDDMAVLALADFGFAVLDVTRAEQPQVVYQWRPTDARESINDVEIVAGRWLLAASSINGLRIFDLETPDAPSPVVDSFPGGEREGHTLFVVERRVYVARTGIGGGVDVMDLDNPRAPQVVALLTLDGCFQVHEVFVRQSLLLASCYDDGLVAFDLTDVTAPRAIVRRPGRGVHSAWLLDDDATVVVTSERLAGPLEVLHLDVEGGSFTPLAVFSLNIGASAHEVHCRKERCWLTHYQEGLLELDLSDPTEPRVTRRIPTWTMSGTFFFEGASSVVIENQLAYLADTERGLLVLERD